MTHLNSSMRWLTCFVVVCSGLSQLQAQEDNQPPNGYRALFNGKDLSGWRGMGHFDPYKLAAMSDEDRDAFFLKNGDPLDRAGRCVGQ